MDYLALGVDLVILGLCAREYVHSKRNMKRLEAAPHLTIDSSLKTYVEQQENRKLPYVVLNGQVAAIGEPISTSQFGAVSRPLSCVLQVIKLSEHRVARQIAGFWSEQWKVISVYTNEIPFELRNKNCGVEVVDALSAAVLDLDVASDVYEPTTLSFFGHIYGFFSGVRQKALQTTELVLREGKNITAVGELVLEDNKLYIRPSCEGPLYLTTSSKKLLIRKLKEDNEITFKLIFFGTVAAILIGFIARKAYLKRKREAEDGELRRAERQRFREQLESRHQNPESQKRDEEIVTEMTCVVCLEFPREIILHPCRHVCICKDCASRVGSCCPVCRAIIIAKEPAYIS